MPKLSKMYDRPNAKPIRICPVSHTNPRKAMRIGLEMPNSVPAVSRYRSSLAPCSAVEMRETKMAPTLPATPVAGASVRAMRCDAMVALPAEGTGGKLTRYNWDEQAKSTELIDIRLEDEASTAVASRPTSGLAHSSTCAVREDTPRHGQCEEQRHPAAPDELLDVCVAQGEINVDADEEQQANEDESRPEGANDDGPLVGDDGEDDEGEQIAY